MVLQLAIDQETFARYDFGRNINFKLYEETDQFLFTNISFNATGYTAVAKFFKRKEDRAFFFRDVERALSVMGTIAQVIGDISVTWDTQSSGIGHFAFSESLRPTIVGNMWLEIQLTKSGEQISSELRKIYIQPSESA